MRKIRKLNPQQLVNSNLPLPPEVPNLSEKQLLKRGYMEMIRSSKICYFMTLTFVYAASVSKVGQSLDLFVADLNKNIYKNRYVTGQNYLQGYVAKEHTIKMKNDHFHILINENEDYNLPTYDQMMAKVNKSVKFVNKISTHGKISATDLQNYYNLGDDALEKYFLKMFDGYKNQNECSNSIGLLDHSGVLFGRP